MSHRMAVILAVIVTATAAAVASGAAGGAGTLARVYADSSGVLHVVSPSGEDRRVAPGVRCDEARLGPDGRTYGALIVHTIDQDPPHHDMIDVRQRLVIWRDGKKLRSFVPGDFIRTWGFWKDGRQIVLSSGGLHFAGQYQLFDLATGRVIDGGEDPITDHSPGWMRSLEP